MNCVLFAKMDQVFSLKNQSIKKYWKMETRYWKSQGSGNFVSPEKWEPCCNVDVDLCCINTHLIRLTLINTHLIRGM